MIFKHLPNYFYGLPKIHKSYNINRAIDEQKSEYVTLEGTDDLCFQPIVGGPNSATHFLDLILKPLCKQVDSFIKDDMDFLRYLPKTTKQH